MSLRTGDAAAALLLIPTDELTAADRWFVRSSGNPGVGSSLAWDTPTAVTRAEPLRRGFRAVIADGRVTPAELFAIAHAGH